MADKAAHLLDRVFPKVPVRQWVLSLPHELTYLLASEPALLSLVLKIFVDEVSKSYRSRSFIEKGLCGAVAAIQRFDSQLRLYVHFHVLFMDGLFEITDEAAHFHEAGPPGDAHLLRVSQRVAHRVGRLIVRRGYLDEDGQPLVSLEGVPYERYLPMGWLTDEGACIQAGWDPGGGQGPSRSADVRGFSVHASVRIEGEDRSGLERLCRYVLRPPFYHDRSSRKRSADGTSFGCFVMVVWPSK